MSDRNRIENYRIEVDVRGGLPSMRWLVDAVSEAIEGLGLSPDGDYRVEVHGPPEMRIVVEERTRMSADQLDLDALTAAVAKMTAGPWDEGLPHWSVIAHDPEGRAFHIAQVSGPVNNAGIVLLRNSAEQLIALARIKHADDESTGHLAYRVVLPVPTEEP